MVQQETNQVNVNAEAQGENPAATQNVEQQTAAPTETGTPEATGTPEKQKKEHPKLDAFVAGAKKAGKVIGVGVLAVGGFIVANKLGKGKGYQDGVEASNEAFNAGVASATPVQELPGPTVDSGVDTSDVAESVDVIDVDQV